MYPDPIWVVRETHRVELLDELERLLGLTLSGTLKDREFDGLQSQVLTALPSIACAGQIR